MVGPYLWYESRPAPVPVTMENILNRMENTTQRSQENMDEAHRRRLGKTQTQSNRSKRTSTQQTAMEDHHTQCCQWHRSTYSNVFATWSPTTTRALGDLNQSIIASTLQSSDIRVQTTCFFTKKFFKFTSTRSHTLIKHSTLIINSQSCHQTISSQRQPS